MIRLFIERLFAQGPYLMYMVVLFGTLGFHPEKFLAAIPGLGGRVTRVIIYTGAQASGTERSMSEAAISKVIRTLDAMGTSYDHRQFSSPWAFSEIFRVFLHDLQSYPPQDVVFNLTGGPKTMTVAATMACLMHGVRVIYVPEELGGPGAAVELPLLRIRYSQVLTSSQRRILHAIRERLPRTLDELARHLKLRNATVSYHVGRLEELGALTLVRDESNRTFRTPQLTPAGEIMLEAEEILVRSGGCHRES
ncbi:MAG: helix-turn-helix domain-containing protein [Candidatus Geothermarchaeales archaeon]